MIMGVHLLHIGIGCVAKKSVVLQRGGRVVECVAYFVYEYDVKC